MTRRLEFYSTYLIKNIPVLCLFKFEKGGVQGSSFQVAFFIDDYTAKSLKHDSAQKA